MKNFKIYLLSLVSTATLEYVIVLVSGDEGSCFMHNSTLGTLFLWVLRLATYSTFLAFFRYMFLPPYISLKERMMDIDQAKGANLSVVYATKKWNAQNR
jgi:hypothetical protein